MRRNIAFLCVAGLSILCLQNIISNVDPKKVLSKQEYALYKAAYLGRTKKVQRLIANGVNVNVKSPNSQRSPLHLAASKGRMAIVQALVEDGKADLEIKNKDNKTPMDFAIEKNRTEIIEYLRQKGAKENAGEI